MTPYQRVELYPAKCLAGSCRRLGYHLPLSSTRKVRGGIISQANRYLGVFHFSQRIFPPQIIQVLLLLFRRLLGNVKSAPYGYNAHNMSVIDGHCNHRGAVKLENLYRICSFLDYPRMLDHGRLALFASQKSSIETKVTQSLHSAPRGGGSCAGVPRGREHPRGQGWGFHPTAKCQCRAEGVA